MTKLCRCTALTFIFILCLHSFSGATPFEPTVKDTKKSFHWVVSRGLDDNTNYPVVHSGNWFLSMNIFENNGWFHDDILTVSGVLYHLIAPHGEAPSTLGFPFSLSAHVAPNLTGVIKEVKATRPHLPSFHIDTYSALLTYSTDSWSEITGYTLTIKGDHSGSHVPVPEPSTFVLLGIGILFLALKQRYYRWCHRGEGP